MTESYKTPLTFDIIKESNTFEDERTVATKELVLITSANENLYLNIIEKQLKRDGNRMQRKYTGVFQPYNDLKNINIDAWFLVEPISDDPGKVRLRHFKSERYLTVINKKGNRDFVSLEEKLEGDIIDTSKLYFSPLDSQQLNAMDYNSNTVFKIKSSPGEDVVSNSYIRFADDEDRKQLHDNNEKIDEILTIQASQSKHIPIVVKKKCSINYYDTFKFVFPPSSTFRELIF